MGQANTPNLPLEAPRHGAENELGCGFREIAGMDRVEQGKGKDTAGGRK